MLHRFGPGKSYVDLSDAIEQIGAEEATLLVAELVEVNAAALEIPANITLRFSRSGSLNVKSGETLTIQGSIQAGLHQIFKGEGQVRFQQPQVRRGLYPGWPAPAGFPLHHGTGGLEALYPQWFGAVMGDREAAAENDRAVSKLIEALPDTGGVMVVTGELHISDTITYPKRQFGDVWRSLNFTISGNGATSSIIQVREATDDGQPAPPAIVMQRATEAQYAVRTSKQVLKDITIISQGNGVEVTGGGKSAVLSNLVIARCLGEYGLLLQEFYGGVIDRVYCFYNHNVGLRLHNCAMVDLHGLTVRKSGGTGIELSQCSGLSGYLYSEANEGWALDADHLRESTFISWFEANRGAGGLSSVQARLRNCLHNRFFGKTGAHRNVAFDTDAISSALNVTEGASPLHGDQYHWRLASDFFGMINGPITQLAVGNSFSGPFGHINVSGWDNPRQFQDDPEFPYVTVSQDNETGYSDQASLRITVKPNAFANYPQPTSSAWIEFYRWGTGADPWQSPLGSLQYQQGDWFLVRFRARTDAAGAKFYRDRVASGEGYALRVAFAGGGPPGSGIFTLTDEAWHTFEWRPQAEADGTGLRLFLYCGSSIDSGPPAEHHIWIDDLEIYHIANTAGYTPAAPPILINDDDHGYPQAAKTFTPGVYITAPRLEIRSDITTPLMLQQRKVFYSDDVPAEIAARGSICFNTQPCAGGQVGWSCVFSLELKTTNRRNTSGQWLSIPVAGLAVGDKVGVVVQETSRGVGLRQRIHWSTIKQVRTGSRERIEINDPIPENTFIGIGARVHVMRWKPFGPIAS